MPGAIPAPQTLWDSVRALPRPAWVLFAGIFLNRFGTFVIPFLTLYMTAKGYSLADAGLAVGSYGTGTLFACLLGGHLADKIGRRKTIAFSLAGGAITMLLISLANSWAGIVLLAGLNGLCGELYRPASSALLADLVPQGQRVIAFSAYRLALNAGWAFGPATAGFLALHSFSWLFAGDALTSLAFGVLAWFALPHGVRGTGQESGWPAALQQIRGDRTFLRLLAASVFAGTIFFQMSSTYGLFVSNLGYSPAVYGGLISFNGVIVVAFELMISSMTRKFAPRRAIAFGYLLVGIGFGLNAVMSRIPGLALGILVFTFGEMVSLPVAIAYIADLAPATMRGRYLGAHSFAWSIALIFAPGLGMFLLARGPAMLWLACALSGAIAAAIVFSDCDTPKANPKQIG
jgi:MFS family permease